MTPKIDKNPPAQTGNTSRDIDGILLYLAYLRENINFALETLQKNING